MRSRFDLDLVDMSRMSFLIHGNFGTGKTFFLGDVLRTEMAEGRRVHFINVKGEDGHLSIAALGLGAIGEHVETYTDYKEAIRDAAAAKVEVLAVDGAKHLARAVIRHHCGDRLPSVGKGSDDWQKIHRDWEDLMIQTRWAAPLVIMSCASDRSMDQVSGEMSLTPDLPGRQAAGSAGLFDFVFILKSTVIGPNRIRRVLQTAPQANTIIRARLPRPLPHEIELPENGGGWSKLRSEIQKSMRLEVLSTIAGSKKETK